MFSKYQLQIIEDKNFALGKNKNLIPNLGNKRKQELHYQNQNSNKKKNLNPCIECHSELPRETKKEGGKTKNENAKLRNNTTFSEPIQNPMNKVDVKIAINR